MLDRISLTATRKILNHYFRIKGKPAGDVMSDGQVEIFAGIFYKVKPRAATLAPTGYGKLIADNTPVLTTKGWKTHGTLNVGDCVFTPQGTPTRVKAVLSKDIANIKVTLSNGASIIVHENHEWLVQHRKWTAYRVVETKWLMAQQLKWAKGKRVFRLPKIEPLRFKRRQLPIDPYTLGVWLGDGSSSKPCITAQYADRAMIERLPYHVSSYATHKATGIYSWNYYRTPFWNGLKGLKLVGNKHIPDIYKYSSVEQRTRLLAGLIDTDGYVHKPYAKDGWRDGKVKIINTNKILVDDIVEVIRSLGMRASVTRVKACISSSRIQGKKDVYYIGFKAELPIPTILPRKRVSHRRKNKYVCIDTIERVAPKQGNCISVEDPSGMYLVGKELVPTHNSEAVSMAVALRVHLYQDDFIIASVKFGTSEIIMKSVIEHIFDSPAIVANLEIDSAQRMSKLKRERTKNAVNFKRGGSIKIVSLHGADEDVSKAIGEHVPNVVLDESPLLTPTKYLLVLKMLEGTGDYNTTFLFELGNAVNRNHFMVNVKSNSMYLKLDISLAQAIAEGRLDRQSVEEKRGLPFFEQFYECKFAAEDEMDERGYKQLLTTEDIDAITVAAVELTDEAQKLGVDVAGGGDYNVYTIRQNHTAWVESKNRSNDTMTNVTEVERIIAESEVTVDDGKTQVKKRLLDPGEVYIDDIGIGRGPSDRLIEKGVNVNGVAVGEAAEEPDRYKNKKADYYWRVREWVLKRDKDGKLVNRLVRYDLNGVNVWHQLTWIKYKVSSDKVLQIEPKPDLKKRTGKSPDFADALSLTFSDPVGQPGIRLL